MFSFLWRQWLSFLWRQLLSFLWRQKTTTTQLPDSTSTMLVLSDDCLLAIFKLLPLREQIAFSNVCVRFENIFMSTVKRTHKNCNLNKLYGFKYWEMSSLLKLAGPSIETISGVIPSSEVFDLIMRNCLSLRKINLCHGSVGTQVLSNLLKMSVLTELTLENCGLDDLHVFYFRYIRNLQKLSLARNKSLEGRFLCNMDTIESLNLSECINIMSKYLDDIFPRLVDLKELDIRYCLSLEGSTFHAMLKHSKKLHTVKVITVQIEYEIVMDLPNLKCLHVYSPDDTDWDIYMFPALINDIPNTLQHFAIESNIIADITPDMEVIGGLTFLKTLKIHKYTLHNADLPAFGSLTELTLLSICICGCTGYFGLFYVLRNCTKLTRFFLYNCKSKVTIKFAYEVDRVLQEESDKRKQPLSIFALDHCCSTGSHKINKHVKKKKAIALFTILSNFGIRFKTSNIKWRRV